MLSCNMYLQNTVSGIGYDWVDSIVHEILWASVAELHYHQPQDLYQNSQNKVEKVGCKRNKQLKIEITILR